MVAGILLLKTFYICGYTVSGFDEASRVVGYRLKIVTERIAEIVRKHVQKPLSCQILHLSEGFAHLTGMILDRRRQIAGEHLVCIMVYGQRGDMLRINRLVISVPANDSQRMGNHGNLQGMFCVVLWLRVAH